MAEAFAPKSRKNMLKPKYQIGTKFITKCTLSSHLYDDNGGTISLNVREGSNAIITGIDAIVDPDKHFDDNFSASDFQYTLTIYEIRENYDHIMGVVYSRENKFSENFDKQE